MKQAVRACMEELSVGDRAASARLRFPADFIGFQGHFPGSPVLPGVCLVVAGVALAEEVAGHTLRLEGLRRAKFLSPIVADDAVSISCAVDDGKANVSVMRGEERVSEFRLTFSREGIE